MAYSSPPAAPARRPTSVTVACWLLYLVAALQLVGAALSLAYADAIQRALLDVYRDTAATGVSSVYRVFAIVGAVVVLLLALALVVLAVLDGRGSNAARIVTWVLAGLGICCTGYAGVSNALRGSAGFTQNGNGNGPSTTEVVNAIRGAVPDWYFPVNTVLNVIGLVALIAIIILLALPASNAFFRRPTGPAWQPPLPPGQAYPPPAYPYPPAGQQAPASPPYPPAGQQSPPVPPPAPPAEQPPSEPGT